MKKIKLYSAMSLNGRIAAADGSVDWLESIPNPDNTDYGYYQFYETIDTTIQGNNTYTQVINWDVEFPYADKKNYVLTRKKKMKNTDFVEFISEKHIKHIQELKAQDGKDIWLIGGGQINTMLLNENLIDEIHVHVMPIVLSKGIELFETIPKETKLELFESKSYESGVVEMKYKVKKTASSNLKNYWSGN